MNESILNILNSTYNMSNKLIPLALFLLFDYISIIELFLHETKPNLQSNISTNWPLTVVLQIHVTMFERNCKQVFHVWSIISPLWSESNSKQPLFYISCVCFKTVLLLLISKGFLSYSFQILTSLELLKDFSAKYM